MADLRDADLARFSSLFGALDEAARKPLLAQASKRACAAGEVVFREGERGDDFFVIVRGSVQVAGDDLGGSVALATLTPGQFFGEVAVLSGQPRQATVTALEPLELLSFPGAAVQEALQQSPAAKAVLQRVGLLRTEDAVQKLMG
jgi:CRP-like cAMP-binding protein